MSQPLLTPYPCQIQEKLPGKTEVNLDSFSFRASYSQHIYLHGKDHNSTPDLMPCKRIGHPDFCDKVEENDDDNGGSSPGLVSEGKGNVGEGVEGEKIEDPVAKEMGGKHCARHHACSMAQPGDNLFDSFENYFQHRYIPQQSV